MKKFFKQFKSLKPTEEHDIAENSIADNISFGNVGGHTSLNVGDTQEIYAGYLHYLGFFDHPEQKRIFLVTNHGPRPGKEIEYTIRDIQIEETDDLLQPEIITLSYDTILVNISEVAPIITDQDYKDNPFHFSNKSENFSRSRMNRSNSLIGILFYLSLLRNKY